MEPKSEQLAKLMIDSVYPRILQLLLDNGDVELRVKIGSGFCDVTFNSLGVIKKINADGTLRKEYEPYQTLNVCPVFHSYSESGDYLNYCNIMMDQIIELEKKVAKVDKVLDRARNVGVTYERKLLTEKTLALN